MGLAEDRWPMGMKTNPFVDLGWRLYLICGWLIRPIAELPVRAGWSGARSVITDSRFMLSPPAPMRVGDRSVRRSHILLVVDICVDYT